MWFVVSSPGGVSTKVTGGEKLKVAWAAVAKRARADISRKAA
jgi:hypothetical protein